MSDAAHRTDTLNPRKNVTCGEQIQHWIEFQLLDEQGEPLVNMPYRAANQATRDAYIEEYLGQSDAEGVIRIDGLHPLALTLKIAVEPLATIATAAFACRTACACAPAHGFATSPARPAASRFFAYRKAGASRWAWLPLPANRRGVRRQADIHPLLGRSGSTLGFPFAGPLLQRLYN